MAYDSPYKTLADIRSAILTDYKYQTTAEIVAQVDRWINEGQENIISRKKRDYLNKTKHISVEAPVETTFSVVYESATVSKTGTATLPFTSVNDHKFKANGHPTVYDISSMSSTSLTLASIYTGTTATAVTGVVFQSSFVLPSDVRSVHKVYHERNGTVIVYPKGAEDFKDIVQQNPSLQTFAYYWTLFGYNSQSVDTNDPADQRKLFFYPYPDRRYTIHYDYNIHIPLLEDDTDEPIIPVQYRQALYWYCMAKIALKEQDANAYQAAQATFQNWLEKFDGEFMPEREMPRIWPDNTKWQFSGRFPYRKFYFEND